MTEVTTCCYLDRPQSLFKNLTAKLRWIGYCHYQMIRIHCPALGPIKVEGNEQPGDPSFLRHDLERGARAVVEVTSRRCQRCCCYQ